MKKSSCIAFEQLPEGGVANPHTEKTLVYIRTLKEKHRITYDTHVSYRFVEKTGSVVRAESDWEPLSNLLRLAQHFTG